MTKYILTKKELGSLIFWSANGVRVSNGGSHEKEILKVIPKFTKLLGWKQDNFCVIGWKPNALGVKLVDELNRICKLRIKIDS